MAEHDYIQESPTQRISRWILSEMMRGAGYAAVVILAIGLLLWAIYGFGLLLPEESKQAPGPMPFSNLMVAPETAQA